MDLKSYKPHLKASIIYLGKMCIEVFVASVTQDSYSLVFGTDLITGFLTDLTAFLVTDFLTDLITFL